MSSPRPLVGAFVLAALVAACGKREQAAPPPTPQAAPSVAATAPPPPTTAPTPPPVWRAARWGMTKDEVLEAFPGEAQRLDTPAPFPQPQAGSITQAGSTDVAIPAYEADGSRFRVLFGFEGDRLSRIHLFASKAGDTTCPDLEKRLTDEFSAPSQRGSTGSSLRGEEIVWRRPDQTVVLACAEVRRLNYLTVALDYLAPAATLASQP
jgi:hypothetical protein